jgi:short-subunit dehydrogenase
MPLTRPLAESVVVITGGSSGIGAATAVALARRGSRLVLAARALPALEQTARACERLGARTLVVPTDVADPDAVAQLASAAVARFGRIDAWINNAAVACYGRLTDIPVDQFRRTLDVNLIGCVNGIDAALPRLRDAGGGVLVTVASTLAKVTIPYLGAYTVTKHGVLALCDTLRQELRADGVAGISVCVLLPGGVDTPLFSHAANLTGRGLRPPPPVTTAARVADRLVRLLEHPRRQAYVGVGTRSLSTHWDLAAPLTERLLTWYGRRAHFVSGQAAPVTTGNLFAPDDRPARIGGGWRDQRQYVAASAMVGTLAVALGALRWYRGGRS